MNPPPTPKKPDRNPVAAPMADTVQKETMTLDVGSQIIGHRLMLCSFLAMPELVSSRGIALPAAFSSALRRLAAIVSRNLDRPMDVMRSSEAPRPTCSPVP